MNDFKNVTRKSGGGTIERLLEACNYGDTMIIRMGTQLAVLMVFRDEISPDNQLALVVGETSVQHSDIGESVRCMDNRIGRRRRTGEFTTTVAPRALNALRELFPEIKGRQGEPYNILKALAIEVEKTEPAL